MFVNKRMPLCVALLLLIPSLAGFFIIGQENDNEKAIKAEVFIQNRGASPAPKKSLGRYKQVTRDQSDNSQSTPPPGKAFVHMGVTLWRFRRSSAADRTKELIEEDDNGPTDWTLERIDDTTPLLLNQKVRLSIESLSRSGYLYVIDREQYGDGSRGDPFLIFPTQKTRDLNYVKAGRIVYIPSATGRFRIQLSNGPKRPVGEFVTMIVSATPLISADRLEPNRIKLSRTEVESWEKQWGANPIKLDLVGGLGQAMTEKEQIAGTDSSFQLTQDDPAPQAVYRLAIKPENPIILSVLLRFKT